MTKCDLDEKLLSKKSPLVIGLTGPIASGKSTVAEFLRRNGALVIDADQVYRSLLVPSSDLWRRLVERFGATIVRPDGEIDRAVLGDLVFNDRAALAVLDRITHPAIVAEIRRQVSQSSIPVVVIEAVKLVESGLDSDVDALWFVTAAPETRLLRLMSRPGMNEAMARARIDAAPSAALNDTHVDILINNSGDLAETHNAVDEAWRATVSAQEVKRRPVIQSAQEEFS